MKPWLTIVQKTIVRTLRRLAFMRIYLEQTNSSGEYDEESCTTFMGRLRVHSRQSRDETFAQMENVPLKVPLSS